jgi:NAD(P)-dependent dehydrogenase (short-subunit alcohol dehydrogenase family)
MSEEKYLAGKVAIVTGASRGIGAAIARELAKLGATLSLMAREKKPLEEFASRLQDEFGGKVASQPCDIGDEKSVVQAFGSTQKQHGPAYILVNNAGQAEGAAFSETSSDLWDRMLAVNLTGTYLCTRQVLPHMLEARAGRIVNIASTAGLKGYSHVAAYCAAKHGVVGLTRALAIETAKQGITVNAVCPSYTDTLMTDANIEKLAASLGRSQEDARQLMTRTIPRGSLITPQEVANAVAWLCSPQASAITGQAIAVAGGEVM